MKGSFARSGGARSRSASKAARCPAAPPAEDRLPLQEGRTAEVLLYQLDKLDGRRLSTSPGAARRRTGAQHREAAKVVKKGEISKKFVLKGVRHGRRAPRSRPPAAVEGAAAHGRSAQAMGPGGVGKFTELRQRLLFLAGAMIVYRIGCFIPVPGVNPEAMLAPDGFAEGHHRGHVQHVLRRRAAALQHLRAERRRTSRLDHHPAAGADPAQPEGDPEGGRIGRRKITAVVAHGAIPPAIFQSAGIATALQHSGARGGIPVVAPGMGSS